LRDLNIAANRATKSGDVSQRSHRYHSLSSGRRAAGDQVAAGITRRHTRRCESRDGGSCSCRPTYQAQAWSARERKPLRRSFPTLSQARAWRQEAQVDLRRRRLNAPSAKLVREAAAEWLEAAQSGVVRTRSDEPYKPSALRGYEATLRRVILPELGHLRLSALTRARIQELVDDLVAAELAPSTVTNAVLRFARSTATRSSARRSRPTRPRPRATEAAPAARAGL
jgi:hypothetical protein